MKICLAQTRSEKGNVEQNVQNHLRFVERAIAWNADLIVFPELSLTNDEPELAQELATEIDDSIFNPFQELADQNDLAIDVGVPTQAINGVQISMLIFQPNTERTVYSKRLLHADELPYFVSGHSQPFLEIHGKKVAFGICYETLQREQFEEAKENHADMYIASVAKPDRGTDKAYIHFPSMASEFGMPILMANCVGACDNFVSNGLSAAWNEQGQLLAQLDSKHEGVLMVDTATQHVEVITFHHS